MYIWKAEGDKQRKTQIEILLPCSLCKCQYQLGLSQAQVSNPEFKPGLLHVWQESSYLSQHLLCPSHVSTGSWKQVRGQNSNRGTPIWDVGWPCSIGTDVPNDHENFCANKLKKKADNYLLNQEWRWGRTKRVLMWNVPIESHDNRNVCINKYTFWSNSGRNDFSKDF